MIWVLLLLKGCKYTMWTKSGGTCTLSSVQQAHASFMAHKPCALVIFWISCFLFSFMNIINRIYDFCIFLHNGSNSDNTKYIWVFIMHLNSPSLHLQIYICDHKFNPPQSYVNGIIINSFQTNKEPETYHTNSFGR